MDDFYSGQSGQSSNLPTLLGIGLGHTRSDQEGWSGPGVPSATSRANRGSQKASTRNKSGARREWRRRAAAAAAARSAA